MRSTTHGEVVWIYRSTLIFNGIARQDQLTTAIITHQDCLKHEMGAHHPECPDRLLSVLNALRPLNLTTFDAPLIDICHLNAAHSPEYVNAIFDSAPSTDYAMLDPVR